MDTNKLRKSLEKFAFETMYSGNYRLLEFTVSEGKSPWKKKQVSFIVPNKDFEIPDRKEPTKMKTMFTSEEAFEIQEQGKDFGLRLPRAHEWRGLGYWITHEGEYVKKFNLVHAGHTWENTDIPQTQDGGAYYWSGSSDKTREHVRVMTLLEDGTFDIKFRSPDESMRLRLIIDPVLLKDYLKNC